ncbi:hypothetical protein PVK06_043494 [Gossypium arboreum]|uniref:Uncharacterized protein n=1 Tax=Gossypium arboreum TaxID=29729 RepID=A0ABR0MNQ5_GOSAR|nr:hypothetical protein PVK06_043494 [Gossypium arboreum]
MIEVVSVYHGNLKVNYNFESWNNACPCLKFSNINLLRTRDIALKRALQQNFTRPILDFPAPKELLPLPKAGCAERKPIEVLSGKEESVTREDKTEKGQASKKDPEKTKSLTIESEKEEQKETTLAAEETKKGKELFNLN